MTTELDEMYIVLKVNDVHMALTGAERLVLDEIMDKVRRFRASIGRPAYRQYTVVSELMSCYPKVTQMVLSELNDE